MIKSGIKINGIYQHYKGDYYKVVDIAYFHEGNKPIVIYHKCDINGVYKSIRDWEDNLLQSQPFY